MQVAKDIIDTVDALLESASSTKPGASAAISRDLIEKQKDADLWGASRRYSFVGFVHP
jgi:hypothetical protein